MMFPHLQIPYRQERWLVGLADTGLEAVRFLGWPRTARLANATMPRRILLLRLEKVGDLVMVLDAIAKVRAMAPAAAIDLVVGSWNRSLAALIPGVHIETLDVPWIARKGHGMSWPALMHRARAWRLEDYDLAINFEPDIRSNLLLALSGASRRVGFASGGGGALLTDAISPDPRAHIAENAKALVARAFDETELPTFAEASARKKPCVTDAAGRPPGGIPSESPVAQDVYPAKLNIPEGARRRAADLLATARQGAPLVGIQPATGRRIKEWDPVRFAEVGAALARTRGATVVLIGSDADKPVLDAVRAAWPRDVALAQLPTDIDLVVLAAALDRLSLLITGDTGPMHLAAAVGTPVLAIFGPSLPTRYAPLSPRSRVVRIDIHCSPCNRMRHPPTRCVGHVPECLTGISTAEVLRVADEMLNAS